MNRHARDMIVIMYEGKRPCYPYFNMFVPWEALNCLHPNNIFCARVSELKQQSLSEEEV